MNFGKLESTKKLVNEIGESGTTVEDKTKNMFTSFFKYLKQPELLDLDKWMDKHYFLPSESASEHGQWRTRRFPFHQKIAKKLSPSTRCKEVGCCKGAQIGLTTIGVGLKLYIADNGLGPTLFIQPTKDSLVEYAEQKLQPAIDLCKKVIDKLGKLKPKHLVETKLRKYFPGGYISLGSSNSAPTLRSKSIRNLIVDEEDGCNQDVNNEGSSIHLAIRRTANFPDSLIFRNSTPILEETSSIEPFCLEGTAERYLVPCPHCNPDADKYGCCFEIQWDYIKYQGKDHRTATLMCPDCGAAIEEHYKTWMMDYGNAFWYRFNPTPRREFEDDDRRVQILIQLEEEGYHSLNRDQIVYLERTSIPDDYEEVCTFFISSLYSPLGFFSWAEAVKMWIEANSKRSKSLLKTFMNTVLGKSWRTRENDIESKELAKRKELYSYDGSFDIPQGAHCVTCGVDVQGDRLEATIKATGLDNEQWLIDYKVFYGDTSILGNHEYKYNGNLTSWGYLHEFLQIQYVHESGHQLPIESTLIDARYRSPIVFRFCKEHEQKRVRAVYGKDGWGEGLIKFPKRRNRAGVWVFDAMQDELKFQTYSQLRNETPGPEFIHFSRTIDYMNGYFEGLVIEELRTKRKGDTDVPYWFNPPGARNEPLDTWNYATVAYLSLRLDVKARLKFLSSALRTHNKPTPVISMQKEVTTKPKKRLLKKKN